jgi:hypothetical protein
MPEGRKQSQMENPDYFPDGEPECPFGKNTIWVPIIVLKQIIIDINVGWALQLN